MRNDPGCELIYNQKSIVSAENYHLLFDDKCPLCTFQMKVLAWLDWWNVVTLMPLSHPRARVIAPQISRQQLQEAIHCITPGGFVYRGARCIRYVGMRMAPLVPIALILWIPGVIWIAERIYTWISRNRYLLNCIFGCNEACSIMQQRRREHHDLVKLQKRT